MGSVGAVGLVIGLVACAHDLDSLEPFPCANDESCPSEFSCVPSFGCTKSPLTKAPFPCPRSGKCPAGLACNAGTCMAPTTDTPCSTDGAVKCDVGDSTLSCASGACVSSCGKAGGACSDSRRCEADHCYADCTSSNTCAPGLACKDTYKGYKVCLGPSFNYSACTSVTGESCTAPTTFTCPDASVQCRTSAGSWTCPRSASCSTTYNTCGRCQVGVATYCNGTACNGSCSGANWACKTGGGTSKPGCGSTLTNFSGQCTCASGRTIPFSCGSSSSTCEALCKTGGVASDTDPRTGQE